MQQLHQLLQCLPSTDREPGMDSSRCAAGADRATSHSLQAQQGVLTPLFGAALLLTAVPVAAAACCLCCCCPCCCCCDQVRKTRGRHATNSVIPWPEKWKQDLRPSTGGERACRTAGGATGGATGGPAGCLLCCALSTQRSPVLALVQISNSSCASVELGTASVGGVQPGSNVACLPG